MSDPIGQLVEFIEKNRVELGLVVAAKKGRLNLFTVAGRQASLNTNRVLFMSPGAMGSEAPRAAQQEYLTEVQTSRDKLAEQVDVTELWELVYEEADPLSLRDLAQLAFGRPLSDDQISATLRALFNERVHFRLAGSQFLTYSPEQLEAKRLQAEREQARQAQVAAGVDFLKGLPSEGPMPEAPPELAGLLVDYLVFQEEASQVKLAKEVVAGAEVGGAKKLFRLLVSLGVLEPHHNLELIRQGISQDFAPEAEAQAQVLDPNPEHGGARIDLTELYTFTIDGNFTTDFDDALSFEPDENGGGTLGVHITDAGAIMPPEGPLEEEARLRATSLYLPDDRLPMLPPRLSEDQLSLRQGELRPALSVLARLDAEGRLIDYRLERSLLKVHKRLTYDEADGMLEGDPRLAALHAICHALRRRRGEAGAYFLPLPEVLVGVDPATKEVWVRRVDRNGPSREMVAETAILGNWLFALFLADSGAPALFRTQAKPSEPIEEGDPSDIYHHFKQRRLLNRVEITTKPGLHSSLGVHPYTQATSPIRRYLDLVMQRQIGSVLCGGPPLYSAKELEEVAMEVGPSVRRAMRVRQVRQRYWLLQWLRQRQDQPQPAVVMERQMRRWQLLLTDIMMLVNIPIRAGQDLSPGKEVELMVERVDPFEDILRVKLT
ncbi:MAG: RNB domain-containing ribonuclease [Desulfarculaceae bacterium]|nr:RNB domain-containing ribonuclease [Desulfarculaceae bacterium]MCF8049292.1 RNB domain-containing ribonuclease [Desulfarculaceae bacterium]MCF8097456.1 RNB domain-containing ribonuclease [Desulfarculaceae bacterium]MCF8122444.1 RNB domain-containing ribonuclease [Desulfarculaceae bacterium]